MRLSDYEQRLLDQRIGEQLDQRAAPRPKGDFDMPEIKNTLDVLLDFTVMVENEIAYIKTGRARGPAMRDCLGQWEATAREARVILDAAKEGEPFV